MGSWADSLEQRAREVLPEAVHRYFRQGARDGVSAAEAVTAWDRYRLVPHVLRPVTVVDTSTTALGTTLRLPVGVAPTTLQRAAHPDGEIAMARAVAEAGSLLVVSSNAGTTFEDIAATGVQWWLQAYLTADRTSCLPLLQRAVDNGARAIVLTADTPVVGTKYDGQGATVWEETDSAWLRVNFAEPNEDPGSASTAEKATDLGPDDIAMIADVTGLPVVVKGVLRTEDARLCVDAGASGVWVSNHGGRQLDYVASTADRLPKVAQAVTTATEVYVDGGVRAARHALTALALGARMVFLGRLPLYALAVGGREGVGRLFAEFEEDLVEAMRLTGTSELQPCHSTWSAGLVDDTASAQSSALQTRAKGR